MIYRTGPEVRAPDGEFLGWLGCRVSGNCLRLVAQPPDDWPPEEAYLTQVFYRRRLKSLSGVGVLSCDMYRPPPGSSYVGLVHDPETDSSAPVKIDYVWEVDREDAWMLKRFGFYPTTPTTPSATSEPLNPPPFNPSTT